jgi:benzoyl-CoA reductase subunit D
MTITAGIDVGTGAVKAALMRVEGDRTEWLSRTTMRIRQRDPIELARTCFDHVLEDARLTAKDVDYIATTGEGESVPFHTGHFYSMTTHARGAVYLEPSARAVLDAGALHGRAIAMDERGKVLRYRMTSQCASGSGQFLENIARYLGVAQADIGALSRSAEQPEVVSSICAVLAETDVINMVSRGLSAANILRGIHDSMAGRFARLLQSLGAQSVVFVSGGLAADEGLGAALEAALAQGAAKPAAPIEVVRHPASVLAGAIGAAIWGAFRLEKVGMEEAAWTANAMAS